MKLLIMEECFIAALRKLHTAIDMLEALAAVAGARR